ncbi:MAG TPA: potassium channel family protein [Solirubrobacterales bacterium]|nr:potassium channel family protein [Solirubrobacterales bacterium]
MSATAVPGARHRLPDALRLTEPRRSFAPVLVAIIAAIMFQLAAPTGDLTHFIAIVLQSAVIVLALRAAGFHRHIVHVVAFILAAVAVIVGVALAGLDDLAPAAPRVLTLVLVLLTPAAIVIGVVRELREDGRVTVQTVFCGLSIYLLLGLAFAVLFGAIDEIGSEPFFAGGVAGNANDFLYFSLASLTTVGYGDLTAGTDLGRAMAVTEALLGQFYLVTVLAVIVANVRRRSE